MFYDERIHAGRGKAFRNTLILAVILLAVYGTIHAVCLFLLHDLENPLAIIIEPVCLLAGLSIIIYGEVSFGGKDRDEMQAYQKNCYYAKAFYVFLYIFAGMYCVFAPIQASFMIGYKFYSGPYGSCLYSSCFKPNVLLFVVEFPCFLFLLLQFKRSEMPINSDFLAEDGTEYWHRVWGNILKFGGYCVLYTLGSFAASVLYFALTSDSDFDMSIAVPLAVVIAGGMTWLSISFEYFVFSAAERVSDRAVQRGQISGTTMAFCWAGYGITLTIDLVYFVLDLIGIRFDLQVLKISSQILYPFAKLSSYLFSLFFIYFLSELMSLRDHRLINIGYAYELVSIISTSMLTCFSFIISTINIYFASDTDNSLYMCLNYLYTAVQMLVILTEVVLLAIVILRLYKHGLTWKWYCLLPILPRAYRFIAFLPEMTFIYDTGVEDGLGILIKILYLVMYTGIWRKLRTSPLPVGEAADENVSADAPFEEAVSE